MSAAGAVGEDPADAAQPPCPPVGPGAAPEAPPELPSELEEPPLAGLPLPLAPLLPTVLDAGAGDEDPEEPLPVLAGAPPSLA